MKQVRLYGPTLVLLTTLLTIMIAGPGLISTITHAQTAAEHRLIANSLEGDLSLVKLNQAFKQISRHVEPSVVHVSVYSRQARSNSGLSEDMLRRFFEDRPDSRSPFERPEREDGDNESYEQYDAPRQVGNGSGWVYDEDGHIITNNHVVQKADKIVVKFRNGAEREATVVGSDPKTDVAVLKINDKKVIPATIAAEPVDQGEIVFAFGSPLQFEFSMSQGIVSGKGRSLGILARMEGYENFIQTDAAINPGNSGGPLTNIRGEVVGMNTAIATRSGGNQGVGFAIPVGMVQKVADQLIDKGRVVRGYLGIYIEDLTQKMADTFDFKGQGVLVANPIEGSPAEKAGVKRGDIITKIDDKPVRTASEMRSRVSLMAPGHKAELTVFRNGEYLDITVTIGKLPESVARAPRPGGDSDVDIEDVQHEELRKLGLNDVATLREADIEQDSKLKPGVLVRSVRRNSAAAAAGVVPGVAITHVMGVRVDNVKQLVEELDKHDLSRGVRMSIVDPSGVERFVVVELDE